MPDQWPSKMYMSVMIIIALVVVPTQVEFENKIKINIKMLNNIKFILKIEHLASLWFERKNLGASYGKIYFGYSSFNLTRDNIRIHH